MSALAHFLMDAAVMRYGKWEYINVDGDEVIPCRYEAAGEFGNGLAPVAINNYGSGGIIIMYIISEAEN